MIVSHLLLILHKKIQFYIFCLKPEMWQKVAKFKGAEYFRKALYVRCVMLMRLRLWLRSWIRVCSSQLVKRAWDLKSEIAEFLQMKGKYVDFPQLQHKEWLADFAFTVDIMTLMNELTSKLQGKGLFTHQMYSLVKAFKGKLLLLTHQVEANNLIQLPTLLVCSLSDDQREKHISLLRALNSEFSRRFEDFKVWIILPLTCNLSLSIFSLMQWLENYSKQCHWHCHTRCHWHCHSWWTKHSNARKMFVLFGSTYVCEQTFSVMKYNKAQIISYGLWPLGNPAHRDVRNYTRLHCSSQCPSETSLLTLIE